MLHRNTALTVAATKGDLAMARLLVAHGADVNRVAGDAPTTALESAAIAGRAEMVAWLLAAGADVPAGADGEQLLSEVEAAGDREVAAALRGAMRKREQG